MEPWSVQTLYTTHYWCVNDLSGAYVSVKYPIGEDRQEKAIDRLFKDTEDLAWPGSLT